MQWKIKKYFFVKLTLKTPKKIILQLIIEGAGTSNFMVC